MSGAEPRRRGSLAALLLFGGLLLAVGRMGVAILQAAPDAVVDDRLAPLLEPARSAAQPFGGVPFAWAPTRLIDSACGADGRTAVLTFESTVGAVRTFATIGFPGPEDLLSPGAVVVIGGSASTSPIASFESADCASVPTGSTAPANQ